MSEDTKYVELEVKFGVELKPGMTQKTAIESFNATAGKITDPKEVVLNLIQIVNFIKYAKTRCIIPGEDK